MGLICAIFLLFSTKSATFAAEIKTLNLMVHFLNYVEAATKGNWDKPALSNYGSKTYTYGEMATSIERVRLLLKNSGIKKGDNVAICSKNSAEWCIAFLAVVSYDAVAVPLLADFLPMNIVTLTKISGCRMLFVDSSVYDSLKGLQDEFAECNDFLGLVDIASLKPLDVASKSLVQTTSALEKRFDERFPTGVRPADLNWCKSDVEALALISYTSGTSSAPKGVMLAAKSISGNIEIARKLVPQKKNGATLSILPLAHIMGLSFDFIFSLAGGCHLNILTSKPTPARLMAALADVKPFMFITVPLLLEKIFRSRVIPMLKKPLMRFLLSVPGLRMLLIRKIRSRVLSVFGENIEFGGLFVGGAAIGQDVDRVMQMLKIPYAVGYGMTECGPLISYKGWAHPSLGNGGGVAAPTIELRIDSKRPSKVPGEIQVRGDVVTKGYYRNEEATKAAFTSDGWLKTGDMGIQDRKGHVYIKGRCKNMILTGSGQNIYPEEIEELINSLPMVAESIVVGRKHAIVALVVLDKDAVKNSGSSLGDVQKSMEQKIFALNASLPAYSKIALCEFRSEPFEKTPKQSIKRFMYN